MICAEDRYRNPRMLVVAEAAGMAGDRERVRGKERVGETVSMQG